MNATHDRAPLFTRVGDERFEPGPASRGPWDPGLLHGGAVGALVAHLLTEAVGLERQPTRLTVDLLRPVPMVPLTVRPVVLRSGARLSVARADVLAGDRLVATASLLALLPTPLDHVPAVTAGPPPDTPDEAADLWDLDPGADEFIGGALTFRFVPGPAGTLRGGAVWLRLHRDIVEGVAPGPLALAAAAADVPSVVADHEVRPPDDVGFINADTSLHLHRRPEGGWMRLTARSYWEPSGIGTVSAALADPAGPVGHVGQALVLARGLRPS